ncbi:OadG family transporter subunit [Luteococcus japonicus]|uniref:Sodium pump decarboxylase gamma subunit n=1 Tax=Luteococcus japonicus LSP_Lj1 TaxID=1255658 RepID=A0A1R4J5H8_9ACTN|nr:OadG family transporter subunit [Luteococcus japonicus]SJN27184.1 sodium pump decarboxylase gamma subunit [Luteococcus japonicus LSP_Lj1]
MSDLAWGLEMTVVGMGVVFALLLLLMGVLILTARLDSPDKPAADEPEPPQATPAPLATTPVPATEPAVEILTAGLTVQQATAVALAVITHAEVRRQQAAPAMRTHAPGSQIHTSRWVSVGRGAQNQSWNRR